ncbi:MAG: Ig-like domain-containing protein [Oscillospiraceae bacterium]|nr:Ig-like domain-containing protein [Oscillospiraceae bacterium]
MNKRIQKGLAKILCLTCLLTQFPYTAFAEEAENSFPDESVAEYSEEVSAEETAADLASYSSEGGGESNAEASAEESAEQSAEENAAPADLNADGTAEYSEAAEAANAEPGAAGNSEEENAARSGAESPEEEGAARSGTEGVEEEGESQSGSESGEETVEEADADHTGESGEQSSGDNGEQTPEDRENGEEAGQSDGESTEKEAEESGAEEAADASQETVSISRSFSALEALETVQLSATVEPADVYAQTLVWSSSAPEVACVDENGLVTALSKGSATVTATAGDGSGASASCEVTVLNNGVVADSVEQLESSHPYESLCSDFWQYTLSGAEALTISFDEQTLFETGRDYLVLSNQNRDELGTYTGADLAGQTVTVPGDTVRLQLVTDAANEEWGFKVSSVEAGSNEPEESDPGTGVQTYVVEYLSNGGFGAPEPDTKTQDVPLTLSSTVPARNHYKFLGWSRDRTAGAAEFKPGDIYEENADLTLYAVWDYVSMFNGTEPTRTTPYYGPATSAQEEKNYPKTPIVLERPESSYDGKAIHIRTVEDLLDFSANCALDTWSDHLPVILDNDLSLSDVDFEPIPIFNGCFEGNGHCIYDLSLTEAQSPCGFFLETGEAATIRNFSVSGSVSPRGDVCVTGGLVGLNRGSVLNCSFSGSVEGKEQTGGLVGKNAPTGLVSGCSTSCTVTGLSDTGGIAGENEGTILSCENKSLVNTESVDPSLSLDAIDTSSVLNFLGSLRSDNAGITSDSGGICGSNTGFVEFCINSGAVGYLHLGYNVGGICGRSCGYVNTCTNREEIYGRRDVGGIVGQAEPYIEISQAQNPVAGLSYRMYALSQSIDTAIDHASVISDDLVDQLSYLPNYLQPMKEAFLNLSLSDPASLDDTRTVIAETIDGLSAEVESMSAGLDEGSDVLNEDFQAISDNINALSGTALQTVSLLSETETEDILEDGSQDGVGETLTLGKVKGCINYGTVNGDSDVGGIAGGLTIENESAPEEDLSTANSLIRDKYSLRTVVIHCVNHGEIDAKKECAGGICGKMDFGYAGNCAAYGKISIEDGTYAGGICGLNYATVENCCAKCSLSGKKYVGGIAGNGYTADSDGDSSSRTAGCYALVEIEAKPQFSGAIAGGSDGVYENNYFVPNGNAGLAKLSIHGQAEPMDYSEFCRTEGLPEEFTRFTLSFVVDGETVKTETFSYGASFDRSVFPVVEKQDGSYAVWDRTDLNDLHFDTVVTATYRMDETVLRSELNREDGRAAVYADGHFQTGDSLSLEVYPLDGTEIDNFQLPWQQAVREQLHSVFSEGKPDYSLCVSVAEHLTVSFPDDGLKEHTLRYLAPDGKTDNYRLYLSEDGGWTRITPETFGSYYLISVPGTESEIMLISTVQSWWYLLYLAAALVLAALIIWGCAAVIRRLRRRPGKEKVRPKLRVRIKEWRKTHKKAILITSLCVLLGILLAASLLFFSDIRADTAIYHTLKSFISEETDVKTEISLKTEGEETTLETTVHRVSVDGKMYSCAEQYGVTLYIRDGLACLENGRVFRIADSPLDQSRLLNVALKAVRVAEISKTQEDELVRYDAQVDEETVERLIQFLLPEEYADSLKADHLSVSVEESDKKLISLVFSGSGTLADGKRCELSATLRPQPAEEKTVLPEAVLDALQRGAEEETEPLNTDFLLLISAWIRNERADTVSASIAAQADCGVISLDSTYSYTRQKTADTEIHSITGPRFRLYFTDDAACTEKGTALSTAEGHAVDTVQLIDIAQEICLNSQFEHRESGGSDLFTIALDAETAENLVQKLLPDLNGLSVDYKTNRLQITVRDGILSEIDLRCEGTLRIVSRDTEAGVHVTVSYDEEAEAEAIPAKVLRALCPS